MIELIRDLSSRRTEVHRDAANQLRCLAKMNSENRLCIAKHGGIPLLASLLRSTDKMTQEHAITALMNLSLQESNRVLIMRAGMHVSHLPPPPHHQSSESKTLNSIVKLALFHVPFCFTSSKISTIRLLYLAIRFIRFIS